MENEEEGLQQELLSEEDLPNDYFTEEQLQEEWSEFLRDLSYSKSVTWNAINNFKLVKKSENQIEVIYYSDIAKREFETVEQEFFTVFKKKVNNFRIEILYREDISLKKEFLTKRQIYNKFVEINPILKDLEDLMDFDFS